MTAKEAVTWFRMDGFERMAMIRHSSPALSFDQVTVETMRRTSDAINALVEFAEKSLTP